MTQQCNSEALNPQHYPNRIVTTLQFYEVGVGTSLAGTGVEGWPKEERNSCLFSAQPRGSCKVRRSMQSGRRNATLSASTRPLSRLFTDNALLTSRASDERKLPKKNVTEHEQNIMIKNEPSNGGQKITMSK